MSAASMVSAVANSTAGDGRQRFFVAPPEVSALACSGATAYTLGRL